MMIVILGPTATGKSDLAVKIAQKLGGEVISADSRQVYKGMDIGTGKITKEEMRGIPHHLLDVADPRERFTVNEYKALADKTIEQIRSRSKIPIICGGTGFYIQAVVDNLILPDVPPDNELRNELNRKDASELFSMLQKLDPDRALEIDPHNKRRLIRAIEICKSIGKVPKPEINSKGEVIFIGLTLPPKILREKIQRRLVARINSGMVDEARRLHEQGVTWERMDELGLEYRYLAKHLKGEISLEEMIQKLGTEIWHYARRQMTWFKRDKRIEWFTPDQEESLLRRLSSK